MYTDHIQGFSSEHNNSGYILSGILFHWILLNINSIQENQFQEKSHNNSEYIVSVILFYWILLNVNSIQENRFQEESQF